MVVFTVNRTRRHIYARELVHGVSSIQAAWVYGSKRESIAPWCQHRADYTDDDAVALADWLNRRRVDLIVAAIERGGF